MKQFFEIVDIYLKIILSRNFCQSYWLSSFDLVIWSGKDLLVFTLLLKDSIFYPLGFELGT